MGVVSFMPETFVKGGGLWDNLDLRFTNARFISDFDYKGKKDPTCVLAAELVNVVTGEELETQVWSVGKGFTASQDGKKPSQTGDFLLGGALIESSNVSILFQSIFDALPDDKKEEFIEKLFGTQKASALDGLEAHMVRKVIKREGITPSKRADGKEYDQTTPVVDTILKFPWEKSKKAPPGASGKATSATAGKPAAEAAAPTGDVTQKTYMLIGQVLADNAEGISRDDLNKAIFGMVKMPKERNDIVKLVYNPKWLAENAEAGGFVYDEEGDMVTAAE